MRKKLLSLLVLLMTAVTGAWAETTIVTWTSSGSYENNNSRGGVTLSGDVVEYIWDDLSGGEWRLAYDYEQGTFTTSLGNFTSIVISGGDIDGFSGTGWNGRTWTGNASSVPFRGYLTDANGEEPWTITFTIAPAGPTEAQEETLLTTITPTGDGTYSETTAGAVTVTPAGSFFYSGSSYGWRWDSYGSLTVTANEGYTITRCVFIQQGKNQSVTISEAPFELNFEEFVCLENTSMDGVTSIEVYGTAPAAPAGYAVSLKAETADEGNWTAKAGEGDYQSLPLEGVAEGTQVTVTYSGLKKVKSVKAKKKAAAPAAAEGHPLSASEVGEIVCSDGLAYAAADKDNLPTGVTAVAIVAYLGDGDTSDNTYNNGLAIAMTNANDGSGCGWGDYFVSYNCVSKSNDIATAIGFKDGISSTNTLTSDGHYHEAATAAVSNNGTAAPTGTSGWFLPSMGQWNLIVQGLASKKAGSAVTTDISTSGNDTYTASNLNSVITDAGGTGFNSDSGYQSSTQYDSDDCWHMDISEGRASNYVFYAGDYVRSVLAF